MLTHNLTHTGKVAGGDSGADRTENFIFPEQKGPETAGYQRFPVFQSVGKDEVGGSNPPSSSRKSSFSCGKGWIFLMFQNFFCWFEFLDLDLTTQPATDREKRLTGGISRSVSRRFFSRLLSDAPFQRQFPFSFLLSSLPATFHTLPHCERRCSEGVFCHPAR